MSKRSSLSLLVAPLALLLLSYCAADRSAPEAPQSQSSTPASKGAEKDALSGEKQGLASPTSRKIIRDGEVQVVVKAYQPARAKLESLVRTAGGFIAKAEVRHTLGKVSWAELELRIPAGRFGGIFKQILQLGIVERESIKSRDITEAYFDLAARLKNAKRLEERYLELMKAKAGGIKELLAVEKELSRVRERVERLEGKLRLYDNLVSLATLKVQLRIEAKYVPPKPPTLGNKLARVLSDSWDGMKAFGEGLLIVAVALLPWLLPLLGVLWLIRRWWRKRRARKAQR
ncbi:MAG: DUF4349 domain-containing protein [Deltaproteobacteria bacterium]|nr:DUF4349 domain-containing protein [Deltaproteobacteria bacterium]